MLRSKKWIAAGILFGLLTPLVWSPFLLNIGTLNQPARYQPSEVDIPTTSEFVSVNNWWNETFRFRTEISITEPGIKNRENQPVTVWMSFEDVVHSRNSTRVVKYDGDLQVWTEIPSQVWNVTTYGAGTFIHSCSITFLVTLFLSQTALYFVYYTSEIIENKTATYQAESSLQSIVNTITPGIGDPYIDSVLVSNGALAISLNKSAGISLLEKNGKNYHTNNSLSPAPRGQVSSGLIGYWNFNEGSGTTAFDTSGNNNHGTLVSNPQWVTSGKEGNAISVSSGSYISAPINRGDSVTFSLWATRNIVTNPMLFLSGPYGAGPDLFYYSGVISWNTWDGATNPFGAIPASSSDGNFHHYVVVVAPGTGNTKLYYDGVVLGTATYKDPSPGSPASTIFQIGGSSGYWWSGKIDEVRMYNRSLTTEEVQLLYSDANSSITSITVQEEGPVFCQYALNWSKAADMNTTDVLTIYNQMSMYTISRTFHWEGNRTFGNNSWQVLNTHYDSAQYYQPDTYCRFFYDESNIAKWTATLPLQSENYTLVRGPLNAGGTWTSLGVFISGYSLGNINMKFSTLRWEARKVNSSYNFIPGNYSDLENFGPHPPFDDYNLTVTFWEMLQEGDSYGTDHASASSNFYTTFDSIKHPLLVEVYAGNNESRFYNLDITVTDWDGNPAVGVNVSLVNATDNVTGWDFNSLQPSAITNAAGLASFTRLLAANYTVNMTYAAYGHAPVNITAYSWGQTNVTLNTTTTLTFEDIPLTRLGLRFMAYDILNGELKGDIIGGNVTFFTNRSGVLDLIGSTQTDSTGNVSFYGIRYPNTEANLTFELEFLNKMREINITTSLWVLNLTLPIESLSNQEVGVKMGDYATYFQVISENFENTHFWGETLTIRVNYTYNEAGSVGNPITGAMVSYQLSSAMRGVFNSSIFVESGQPGIYELTLDTTASWLDLHSSTNYYVAVKAERLGYTNNQTTIPIVLKAITTSLSAIKTSIQVYWLDNVSSADARFYFNDTLNSLAITGAILQYSVPTLPFITGILQDEGNGWYNFTINSTAFTYTGAYVLAITAIKDNYAQSIININLQVLQIRTYIAPWNNPNQQQLSFVLPIRINVTTQYLMWFNYTDTFGNGIPDAAIAEYEWQDSLGGKHIDFLTNEGNGNYSLDFNTANRAIDTYSLVVTIAQTNYKERSCVVILSVEAIPIILTPFGFAQGEVVKSPQGENIVVRISLVDSLNGGALTGATVQLKFGDIWQLMHADTTNLGEYYIELSTASYDALFAPLYFPAQIHITKDNYTLATDFVFTISIAPPELLGVPIIYWIIAIVAIGAVIGIMVSVKAVQRARIPQVIKDIAATRDLIKKRRSLDKIEISPTKAEMIRKMVEGEWATIGVNLPAPAKAQGEETRPEPEELEKKEATG